MLGGQARRARNPAAHRGRALAASAGIAAGIALLALPASGAARSQPVPAHQPLVVLLAPQPVRAAPAGGPVTAVVAARRPITGVATTLPVLARAVDARGRAVVRVRLPGRALRRRTPPATGWIRLAGTRPAGTVWHLVVTRTTRTVAVYRQGRVVRRLRAIVGAPGTPTPAGQFFVEENVRLPADRIGAPFALAASARSAVFQEFDGGPGQIAIHGRGSVGGRLGSATSHGCVRLADQDVSWLALRIRPGTPITIR